MMTIKSAQNGLTFAMTKGPFQNNGAAPWYTNISIGTPGQPLQLAIDTGTNITWTTSTLCPPTGCLHYSNGRFDYQASSTFSFTDCLQRPYSFGPWGTMQVETGADVLTLPGGATIPAKMFLSAEYSGSQFAEIDWDGGIGMPSSSAYVQGGSSFLFQDLMIAGLIDPTLPYVAFDWDPTTRTGTCQMGGYDETKTQGPYLYLPWSAYSDLSGVEYLWSTNLLSYQVGEEVLANDIKFALDTGSSQFKGDDTLMDETLANIASMGNPDVVLTFADGYMTVDSSIYNVLIEEGSGKGQVIPQFAPLGMTNLALVGSVLMDYLYTVHEYQVVQCSSTVYSLAPVGMYVFNRPGGPKIIKQTSTQRNVLGRRKTATRKITFGR